MHIRDAMQLVCGEICLQVNSVIPGATQEARIVPGKIDNEAHVTWLAKGTQLFTLIKCGPSTLVFCHTNKTLFYANQNFMLHRDTPEGHAFLAQVVEDRDADGSLTPRMLIMDLICPKVEDPRTRGNMLRQLAGMFPSTCTVQWSGQPEALRRFLKNGLPHEVDGIVALRAPLRLIREMQAKQVTVQPRMDLGVAVEIKESRKNKRPAENAEETKDEGAKRATKKSKPSISESKAA